MLEEISVGNARCPDADAFISITGRRAVYCVQFNPAILSNAHEITSPFGQHRLTACPSGRASEPAFRQFYGGVTVVSSVSRVPARPDGHAVKRESYFVADATRRLVMSPSIYRCPVLLSVVAQFVCSIHACSPLDNEPTNRQGKWDEPTERVVVDQPLQDYLFSFEEAFREIDGEQKDFNPFRFYTHIGTDYGCMGPGENSLAWQDGTIRVKNNFAWAGMWQSLAGLARQQSSSLDLKRCYPPWIREPYQPRCVALKMRVQGQGLLKVELKSAEERVLWREVVHVDSPDRYRELRWGIPRHVNDVKLMNWVAERGSDFCIDSIALELDFPKLPTDRRTFLVSYAKLARCYSPEEGVVRDRAHWPAGDFDCVPTSGLFCLATCAAWRVGIVEREFAQQALHRVHQTISRLPTAAGLPPHFIRKVDGVYRIHKDTEYSTADASLYFHSMLLASQMLDDKPILAELTRAIRAIEFDKLRDKDGYIVHGLEDDGQTRLPHVWRDWGGETALVLLLARMSDGEDAVLKMDDSGRVFGGVGFIPEVGMPVFAASEHKLCLPGTNKTEFQRFRHRTRLSLGVEKLLARCAVFIKACPTNRGILSSVVAVRTGYF